LGGRGSQLGTDERGVTHVQQVAKFAHQMVLVIV